MIQRYVDIPSLSWEQRYHRLEKHHQEETELVYGLLEELFEWFMIHIHISVIDINSDAATLHERVTRALRLWKPGWRSRTLAEIEAAKKR